ncbi:MAG TPA: Omp28-related outer membrane protein [Candidatus Coprenecus stercoravium]|uniref:Omp28-related outer membrane protein n=1 Tax=Candidatus Coprenecus stercoravium TaxID=2840735 RepID=A0A9D2K9X5_9BACT|nr:Omp28-related outer membrane protein [Candidatus Coprenecus stercoravium]
MKTLNKMFLCLVSVLGMTALLVSCEENNGNGPDNPVNGTTISLPNEANASASLTLEFLNPWEVINTETWFSVMPLSGAVAGSAEITVEASSINPDFAERVGSFMINDGGLVTSYFVIQAGTPGIDVAETKTIGGHEQTFVLSFTTNIEGVSASSDAEWLTINGDVEYGAPNLLEDGLTESKLRTATLSVKAAANEAEESRTATLTLKAGDVTKEVKITQTEDLGIDFSSEFFRRTLVVKFTSTGCTYCPNMSTALENAVEQSSGRIVPINIYGTMGGMSDFLFDNLTSYGNLLGWSHSYPWSSVNYCANVASMTNAAVMQRAFLAASTEATEQMPANTAIAGFGSIEGDQINMTLSIASKEAGSYMLNIFVLEDGVQRAQVSGGSNYIHNHIALAQVTATIGDGLELEEAGLQTITRSFDVPEDVVNENNLHVVVFISKQGSFAGNAANVTYSSTGYVVDNAVDIPLNGATIPFQYEN